MRIGIVALLHESNTFVAQPTTLDNFRQDLLMEGEGIREALADSHHEVGGFFAGLEEDADKSVEAVPLFAARATPSGVISAEAFDFLVERILYQCRAQQPLDGILVAPHGAAVSELYADADGAWLARLRRTVGNHIPIIGTLDAHANLSPQMVASCDALIAYRTNPHLDQRQRGREAAVLMLAALRGHVRPTMAAAFPPLVINIERQCTSEPHWAPLYARADEQLENSVVLSNSILLGFPYSDVPEMGAATLCITDNDVELAHRLAQELADQLWAHRESWRGELVSVDTAIDSCEQSPTQRFCLLDMGDNVGGGSSADGTQLAAALLKSGLGKSFVCLFDPDAVAQCRAAGIGTQVRMRVGGKSDTQHGPPIDVEVCVRALCDGVFRETVPRHGGIVNFDQGDTAIVTTPDDQLTIMLTSRRMVPFSIQQLVSCGLDPRSFRVLVAKGVNAPIAAYRDTVDAFIRVNTLGSTCADLDQLAFVHRRHPLYPFEDCAGIDRV